MKATAKDTAVISASILQNIRKGVDVQFPTADSVVLHSNDLNSMRANSKYVSLSDREAMKQQKAKEKMEKNQKAQLRKSKMLAMSKKANKAKPQLSALEKEKLKERELILTEANDKMLKNNDKVKQMASLVLYAKCAAIRDRQLTEKQNIKALEVTNDKALDQMMEIDRLNAIKKMNNRDLKREQATKDAAQIIVKQLAQNEQQRILDKEQKILEGQEMLARIEILQNKEAAKQKQKLLEGQQLLEEIKQSNQQIAAARALEKERQRLEDEKIAKYIVDKDLRQAAYEKELAEIEAQKEKQKKKLSLKQGQQQQKEKQLEDIRIRRSQEKAEREWRAKEAAKAMKKLETKQMLADAREAAQLEKELRLAEQAASERMEFEKNVSAFHAQQNEITRQQALQQQGKAAYRQMLQKQMSVKEKLMASQNVNAKEDLYDYDTEKQQLQAVKQAKIAELKKCGVPEKYMTDLMKFQLFD